MTMHPVNGGVGVRVMGGNGGAPGITETEDAAVEKGQAFAERKS